MGDCLEQFGFVDVLDGGTRLRHIRTGKAYEGWVEVLSGLQEGDVVLTGGGK